MLPFSRDLVGRVVVLSCLWLAAFNAQAAEPPNFLVILTDDQSWVGTSLRMDSGDPRSKSDYFQTPHIERLADEGMRFSRGYAPAPYCCPTRRSLLIGQSPARHIYHKDQPNWTTRYRGQLSLPQMLKRANPGYRTAHFGKWDLRFDRVTPEAMGYDVSDGDTGNGTGGGKGSGGPAASDDPKLVSAITRRATDFMARCAAEGNPFYVQVSHYAVHLDIYYRDATLAGVAKMKRGQKHTLPEFAAMTRDLDEAVGNLLESVETLGLSKNTYVFFLSDNGGRNTVPGESQRTLPRNSPLRDGKGSVYEGGIRVPFLVRGPGIEPGVVSSVSVTGLDLFPTCAELAGYREPLPKALDGGSLAPVLFNGGRGRVERSNPFLLFHQAVARPAETALIRDNYKLVKTWAKNQLELFDLAINPEEDRDLASAQPERVEEMHALMTGYLSEVGAETRKTGTKAEVYERATPKPQARVEAGVDILPFGDAGKFKMLYDVRQRPQSVLLHDRLYLVYNADAVPTANGRGEARPMLITYDPRERTFSESVPLGPRHSDHHFSPIIWADEADFLHVLHGCHKTPGTHLVSSEPVRADTSGIAWREGSTIAAKLSYPTVYRVEGDREVIYYRTGGHTSSWSYRISDDNGRTWKGPVNAVTDLDSKGRLDWSSYQTKIPSRDGRYLHVVYTDYDDNKHTPSEERFFNPRYDHSVNNEWKYNLSYLRVDLRNHDVWNADGERLRTPIDIDYSKAKCQIWDTEFRGAGIPPALALDGRGEPTFLHVLSGADIRSHQFYYVRRVAEGWRQTAICPSNHQWNSGHLRHAANGDIHAYVVSEEGYLAGGYMDGHGGGRIEEWVSTDAGETWHRRRVLSPQGETYAGWRFNNVQPVLHPDGSEVPGMLLFYGWKDPSRPEARAFLLHE